LPFDDAFELRVVTPVSVPYTSCDVRIVSQHSRVGVFPGVGVGLLSRSRVLGMEAKKNNSEAGGGGGEQKKRKKK
jgi:hypothetical protein